MSEIQLHAHRNKNKTNRINLIGNNRESRWSRKKHINLTANNCVNCFAGNVKFVKMDALQTSNRNGFLTTNLNILMMLLYNQIIHITNLFLKYINECMYKGEKV